MRLSLRAIELCRIKFGKGEFCGFEQVDESVIDSIAEEDAKQLFKELTENGIVDFYDGNIHISALGQHIFNMMLGPEQYIMLDNEADSICVRIYIRNTYYLCVIEDKKIKSKDGCNSYIFELLPRLDLIIGAFVYALHRNERYVLMKNADDKQAKLDLGIVGKAWNKDRKKISEITIYGNYHNGGIHYQTVIEMEGFESKLEEFESETSELINKLTGWMFEQISAINEREGD